jgi:flagellar basal-body rod protein FlgF
MRVNKALPGAAKIAACAESGSANPAALPGNSTEKSQKSAVLPSGTRVALSLGNPPALQEQTMQNATTIALSRLVAQSRAMEVVANNLANTGTPGYKAERMVFADWLFREPNLTNTDSLPPGGRTLAFTQDRATYREAQVGAFTPTANPLDLAIGSNGFFTVLTGAGPRLTRAGHFERANDGKIVDEAGNPLLDINGKPLTLAPADTVLSVAGNGVLSSQNGQIGQIGVVAPQDPNKMRTEGQRLLVSDSPTKPVEDPKITQGSVEDSNVRPIGELIGMMTTLREFQFTTQFVQAEADRQQSAIDKITQHTA